MNRRPLSTTLLVLVLAGSASLWLRAQTPTREADMNQIPIDADDIAGVVTSARGPEAGVWVIAETTDMPTKFRKIVVTDDQGRYLLPDLPGARHYRIWVRGYGLVDSTPVRATPGRRLALTAVVAPDRPRGRADLSGELLVLADQDPAGEGVSGHGSARQRHQPGDGDAASLDQPDQGELQRLPSAGQQGDARDSRGARDVCVERRGLGSPRPGGPGRRGHERRGGRARARARPRDVRRLDGSDRRGRSAARAAASAGHRAESRADDVGLGRPGDVRARRAGHRQTEPDGERERPDLRRRLGQRRVPHARSAGAHGEGDENPGARSENAARQAAVDAGAVAVLGHKLYWFDPAITNHAAMDSKGRVWMSSRFRLPENQPSFCKDHPSAALAPQPTSFRQIQYYDPRTQQFHQVDICFDTHHVQFAPTPTRRCTATASSAARSAG